METNDRFNAELATLTEENKDKVILSLGMPSEKLLAGGVVNRGIKIVGVSQPPQLDTPTNLSYHVIV